MKRARTTAQKRGGAAVRWTFRSGRGRQATSIEMPADRALAAAASQLRRLAASLADDDSERQALELRASIYQREADTFAAQRAVAEDRRRAARAGGRSTARTREAEARTRDALLREAALALLADSPSLKMAALAAMLSERGLGGAEALRKKLPRLLGYPPNP